MVDETPSHSDEPEDSLDFGDFADADWSDATPVCPGCLTQVDSLQHYCHHCGKAVGQFTPNIPFVNIPFLFEPVKIMWERVWVPRSESAGRRILYSALLVLIALSHTFGWILLLGIPFWWRRAYRLRHHLCLKCGYDRTQSGSACPECGAAPS